MVTIETMSSRAPSERASPDRSRGALAKPVAAFVLAMTFWLRRRRTRLHLAQLTEEQLRDVGLTPEMAEREIGKSRLLMLDRPYQPPF